MTYEYLDLLTLPSYVSTEIQLQSDKIPQLDRPDDMYPWLTNMGTYSCMLDALKTTVHDWNMLWNVQECRDE